MRVYYFCYYIILVFLGLFIGPSVGAQEVALHPEVGRSLLKNFSPAIYGAEQQNWAFVEDERGIIYVGNESGILEFDGVNWHQFSMPNHSVVRSLARDDSGRIWVGGSDDMGYLSSDSLGSPIFTSILDKIPEEYKDFDDVWNTFATKEGIYFCTSNVIFCWNGSMMKTWPAETSFHVSSIVDGDFYVRQFGIGLMRMENNNGEPELQMVPDGEKFANLRIYVMLPYGPGKILIGTREENLFIYDGEKASVFQTEADSLFTEDRIYMPGIVLPNGRFGFGTISGGLIVIDSQGNLVEQIDTDAGLLDNTVLCTYLDKRGFVWLGLDSGIARVKVGSELTSYDFRTGLPGWVSAITRSNGKLFAGLPIGLKRLDPSTGGFTTIKCPLTQVFSLLQVGEDLLVTGANEGVYRVVGDSTYPVRVSVLNDYGAVTLHQYSRDSNLVFVGLRNGLGLLRKTKQGWMDLGNIPELNSAAWTIAESENGDLWLGSLSSNVVRVRLPETDEGGEIDLTKVEVSVFGTENGLIEGAIRTFNVGGKAYFTGLEEKVFRFNESTGKFISTEIFSKARCGNKLGNFRLREDDLGNIWIASTFGAPAIGFLQADGTYTIEILRQFRDNRIIDIFPEADGIVWLIGDDELIRYDLNSHHGSGIESIPLVRRVLLGENTLLYGGTDKASPTEIAHQSGAIRFSYAAPGLSVQPKFRTQLEGFDKEWSSWSTITDRSYTNLPPGDYTFLVESEEKEGTSFNFTVLPPLHRTWWAFMIYAIVIIVGLEIGRQIMKRRLHRREKRKFELKEERSRIEKLELKAALNESERIRMENELNIGHNIQMGMLINDFPLTDDIEVYAALKPAKKVGGDLYDVFYIDEEHLCCVVGDVSGKGLPAALFMAMSKTLIKAIASNQKLINDEMEGKIRKRKKYSSGVIMGKINDELSRENDESMFVTAFMCIVNIKTGHVTYTNAGHNAPYLLKNNKKPEVMNQRHGPVLGAITGLKYGEDQFFLKQQDTLMIFTDGVTEAFNNSKEMYTKKRFEEELEKEKFMDTKELVNNILRNVSEFEGECQQTDDITVMAVQKKISSSQISSLGKKKIGRAVGF